MAYIRTAFTENGTFVANAMKVAASGRLTATFDAGSQSVLLDLAQTGVTAGTFNRVVVDAFGRVTDGSFAPFLLANQPITLSGDATGSGTTALTVTLTDSGVSAGTYSFATVAVDAKGRVTLASSGSIPSASVAFSGDATGSGFTGGTIALSLANTGVPAGTFNAVTVDAKGRVTAGQNRQYVLNVGGIGNQGPNVSLVENQDLVADDSSDLNMRLLAPGQGVTLSGGGGLVTVGLSLTGVTAGTYSFATVEVDARGRVTAASSGSVPALGISFSGDATGSGSTGGTVALTLADSGVSPGTFALPSIAVDSKGRVTFAAPAVIPVNFIGDALGGGFVGSNLTISLGAVGVAGTYNRVVTDAKGRVESGTLIPYLTANQPITLSGDATGTGSGTIAVTLENSGVSAGTYSLATVGVDSKGRVVSATPGSAVTSVALAGSEFSFAGGPVTSAGTISLALAPTGVAAGTFTSVVVDAKGRVAAGSNPGFLTAESDTLDTVAARGAVTAATLTVGALVGNASSATALQTARTISLTGDATGSADFNGTANAPVAVTLTNSGVAAGTYSFATVAVDAKGRVTFAASGSVDSGPVLATGTFNAARVTVDASGRISAVAPTTVSNRGTAAGLMVQSPGSLSFKSIRAGSGVTVTQGADEVTIAATSSGPTTYNFRITLLPSSGGGAVDTTANPVVTNLPAGWSVTAASSASVTVNTGGTAVFLAPAGVPIITVAGSNATNVYSIRTAGGTTGVTVNVSLDGTSIVLGNISATNTGANAPSNNHLWVRITV